MHEEPTAATVAPDCRADRPLSWHAAVRWRSSLAVRRNGVSVWSSGNTVRDNQIADQSTGVSINGDDNVPQGNDVEVNVSGTRALSNACGIEIDGGSNIVIGGTAQGEGNLVSGNRYAAIHIEPANDVATGNEIQGNLIGTTSSGRTLLPNADLAVFAAVTLSRASGNTIGGKEPGAGNVISSNATEVVLIEGEGADNNRVLGNWIGTDYRFEACCLDGVVGDVRRGGDGPDRAAS
jgi:hypothetical protein